MKFVSLICFICVVERLPAVDGPELGRFAEVCSVSFPAKTQMGKMEGVMAVCRLESSRGWDGSLYILTLYEREYPPHVERILETAHSPIIEKAGATVSLLYTSGANTTCVTQFSVENGCPSYLGSETIAWNDGGVFRTSDTFALFEHLLEKRKRHNQSVETTPVSAPH